MFKQYDAYKDSGVEWIEDIPTDWSNERLGAILEPVSIKGNADKALLSITREKGVILRDVEDDSENHNFIPDDLSNYKLIEKGQFGMNKMKAWQGSYGVSPYTGIVSPAYYVFRFIKPIYPAFFHWAIRSKTYISFFGSASDGVRIGQWDLSKDRMKNIPFVFPDINSQQKIVDFIKEKAEQIDQAIAIKEQQIALLNERKQIVIQKAVTQGLDPNVPMKDSGVEWIGEIPEQWGLLKLKNIAFVNPTNTTLANNLDKNTHVCFLAMESVGANGTVDYSNTRNLASVRSGFTSFVNGDVLVAKITPCFENGKGAYLEALETPIGFGSTEFHVLRVKKNCNPKFLYYVTKTHSFMDMGEGLMIGSAGQKRVPTSFMQNYVVAIPDMATQVEIVSFIDQRLCEIAEAIILQKMQIEKLKEYKTTLINDAVTGKIRVA